MKALALTHNTTDKEVIVNWDNVLYVAETENTFNEKYTEVAFADSEGSIGVKQSPEEILLLLNGAE